MSSTFLLRVNRMRKQKFVRFGLPFMLLVVGGSFGLREFNQVRYTYSKKTALIPDSMEKHGVRMKSMGEVTIDTEYDKLKTLNIDNWEQKRGPRPWEEKDAQAQ